MKKVTKKKKWIIILIVFFILSIWLVWSSVTIKVTNINIIISDLPTAFKGFTIAQISDLHNGHFGIQVLSQ